MFEIQRCTYKVVAKAQKVGKRLDFILKF